MKKIYFVLGLLLLSSYVYSQSVLPFNDSFSYPNGDLNGKGNWTVQSANATDKILVENGVVKFDGIGEDLKTVLTKTTSGTLYAALDLKVTNVTAATNIDGGYIAGFAQNDTTFGGTLWLKKETDTTFRIGIEVRTAAGASTSWSNVVFNINTVYNIVVAYKFNTGSTSDDIALLYVNGGLLITDNHVGTDLTEINAFFLRQDSVSETPFVEIDNLKVSTTAADVLGVSDSVAVKDDFVLNTLVGDAIRFGAKSEVKIHNLNGQLVKSATVDKGSMLNVSNLKKGIYIVSGNVNGTAISQKITKN